MTDNKDTEDGTTRKLTFSGSRLTLGKSSYPKGATKTFGSSGSTVVVEVKRGRAVSNGIDLKEDSKKLGDMINVLLEIAKVESQANLSFSNIRLDELVFENIENSNKIAPNFKFKFEIDLNKRLPYSLYPL